MRQIRPELQQIVDKINAVEGTTEWACEDSAFAMTVIERCGHDPHNTPEVIIDLIGCLVDRMEYL